MWIWSALQLQLAKFRGVRSCHFFMLRITFLKVIGDARNLMNHMDLDEKDKVALLALEFACDFVTTKFYFSGFLFLNHSK